MLKQTLFGLVISLITFCGYSQVPFSDINQKIFKGNFTSAKSQIKKEFEKKSISKKEKAQLYHILGDMSKTSGDMDGALKYWEKAATYRNQIYPNKSDYHHAWKYAHLSNFHYEKINFELAKLYADSCSRLISNLSLEKELEIEVFKIWNILGQSIKFQPTTDIKIYQRQYDECIQLYKNSIQFQLKNKTHKHFLANTYHLIANAHLDLTVRYDLQKNKVESRRLKIIAESYYEKAKSIWRELYGSVHYELGKTTFVESFLYHYLSRTEPILMEEGILNFRNAIKSFGLNIENPSLEALQRNPNKEDLLMCLKYYTTDLLKILDDNPKRTDLLVEAEKVNQLAILVWKQAHSIFESENTNQGLAIYNLIPQQEEIAILFRNYDLKDKQLIEGFFNANQKLKYYDLNKSNGIYKEVTLSNFQKQLRDGQAFLDIHFAQSNSEVYVLEITNQSCNIRRIDDDIYNEIQPYRNSILELDYEQFTKSASSLYKSFFSNGLKDISEIIICPDWSMATIPFEALLHSKTNVSNKDYRKLDYLINHVNIRYAQSSASFSNICLQTDWNLAIYSPSYKGTEYSELPFSEKFSDKAIEKLQSKVLKGKDANSKALIENTDLFVHLSTHAIIGEDATKNFFLLSDGPFYQGQLANIKNLPQLMIINSCNSGIGKHFVGDGINGLVRELHRLGVKSTISNLWEVDDQASNELFLHYYSNFKDGKSSVAALKQAKLSHIKNAPSSELGAPYYWAGHIINGSEIEVTQKSKSQILILLLTLLGIGLVSTIFISRYRGLVKAGKSHSFK